MHRRTRRLFWLELVVAVTGFVMAIVTLVYPPWIEAVFGVDPDGGSGALEAAIATALVRTRSAPSGRFRSFVGCRARTTR